MADFPAQPTPQTQSEMETRLNRMLAALNDISGRVQCVKSEVEGLKREANATEIKRLAEAERLKAEGDVLSTEIREILERITTGVERLERR